MRRKLILACALLLVTGCARPEPLRDLTIRHADGRMTTLQVEIADSPPEWEQGLMGRQSLAERHGMYFIFDRERPLSFWMKNTPLFLDIIFMDRHGRIVTVHAKARPYDETLIPSRVPSLYVLEIAGGEAKRLDIRAGDHATLD